VEFDMTHIIQNMDVQFRRHQHSCVAPNIGVFCKRFIHPPIHLH